MSTAPSPAVRPSFHGWRVAFAALVAQFVANTAWLASASMFVTPIEREFETTRSTISLGMSLCILLMGLVSPFVGRWIDAGPQRAIMIGGVVLLAAGLWLSSLAESIPMLGIAFCGVATSGILLFGPLPSVALVSRWFVRRRGLAVGVAVSGATFASAAGPALAAWLIDGWGWRVALQAYAVGALAIAIPVFALFVIKSPEDVGQHPDGDAEAPPDVELSSEGSVFSLVVRRLDFYIIALGMALVFASPIVSGVHLTPFAEAELGLPQTDVAPVFVVMAVCSLVGKIVFGAVVSRIPPQAALFTNVALLAAAWALLWTRPDYTWLLVAGALFGLGIGAAGPLHAVLIGACFGRKAFGEVMGLGGLVALPIIAGANWFAGLLHDASGHYSTVFAAELVALALAAAMFLFLRIPSQPGAELEPPIVHEPLEA